MPDGIVTFIDVPLGSNESDLLSGDKFYIVRIYGRLYGGYFRRAWYGWYFDGWVGQSIQLDSHGIEKIWEVTFNAERS